MAIYKGKMCFKKGLRNIQNNLPVHKCKVCSNNIKGIADIQEKVAVHKGKISYSYTIHVAIYTGKVYNMVKHAPAIKV